VGVGRRGNRRTPALLSREYVGIYNQVPPGVVPTRKSQVPESGGRDTLCTRSLEALAPFGAQVYHNNIKFDFQAQDCGRRIYEYSNMGTSLRLDVVAHKLR